LILTWLTARLSDCSKDLVLVRPKSGPENAIPAFSFKAKY